MKKVFFIALLILIITGIWYAMHRSSAPAPIVNQPVTTASRPNLSNATFTFDNEPVTLKNSKNVTAVAPNSAESIETDLTSYVAYGDINKDGTEDAAAILTQSGAGSGTFVFVAAYVSSTVTYMGTNAVFIGDRVEPKSISIKNGVITISYLDRKPDEPLSADPTVLTTKTYKYSSLDNSLSEQ